MASSDVSTPEKQLVCIPGQRICRLSEQIISGEGTYERLGYVYANISGVLKLRKKEDLTYVEVLSPTQKTILPIAGDVVTCRVQLINSRFAKCAIISIGDIVLTRHLRGMLRREDVRATEKDRIEMYKCFRPGDIILAKVLPQTELHTYHLTTAENELGVVLSFASGSDVPMVPISWTEMQCPQTLQKQPRKIARILPESKLKVNKETNKVNDEKMEQETN